MREFFSCKNFCRLNAGWRLETAVRETVLAKRRSKRRDDLLEKIQPESRRLLLEKFKRSFRCRWRAFERLVVQKLFWLRNSKLEGGDFEWQAYGEAGDQCKCSVHCLKIWVELKWTRCWTCEMNLLKRLIADRSTADRDLNGERKKKI